MDTHVDISVTAREQVVDLPDLWQTIRLPARIQCAGPSQASCLTYCELYVLISIYQYQFTFRWVKVLYAVYS